MIIIYLPLLRKLALYTCVCDLFLTLPIKIHLLFHALLLISPSFIPFLFSSADLLTLFLLPSPVSCFLFPSLSHSHTHSHTPSFTHTHTLTRSFTHSLPHSLPSSHTHSLHPLPPSLSPSLLRYPNSAMV